MTPKHNQFQIKHNSTRQIARSTNEAQLEIAIIWQSALVLEPLQKLLIMRHIKIHRVFEVKISVWGFCVGTMAWLPSGKHTRLHRFGNVHLWRYTRTRAYAFTHPCAAPRTKTQSGRRELCLPAVGKLSGNFGGFAYQQPGRQQKRSAKSTVGSYSAVPNTSHNRVCVCNNAANASFPTCVDQMMCAREQNMCTLLSSHSLKTFLIDIWARDDSRLLGVAGWHIQAASGYCIVGDRI